MLNRSAILKDAWFAYRLGQRGKPFNRKTFGFYLGCAWDRAKASQLSPVERRKLAIRAEIESLPYRDTIISTEPRLNRLKAELQALAA